MSGRWRVDGPSDAPPLVLLNSIGTNSEIWTPCLGPMVEQFRVIRIELPGHDGTPVETRATPRTLDDLVADVLAVLDENGVECAHLAGISIGAMTAIRLAATHPARVGRLALLCTTARPDPQRYRDRAAAVRTTGMTAVAEIPRQLWVTNSSAPDLLTQLEQMQGGVDSEGYAQCCDVLSGVDLRPHLPRVAAPTLVVAGADDPAAPPEQLRAIAEGIAGARLVVLEHAAHIPTVERPGAVAQLLLDHLVANGTRATGFATRRAVLGNAHVDAAIDATTSFTEPFQDFITRYAWGEVWSRPGLGRRERSVATLAVLVSLGAEHEIAMHVRAAVRNGLTSDEIAEVLLHTALYAGLPRANRAFAIARDVLSTDEREMH